MLKSDLTGRKAELLAICYRAIQIAEENWIEKAVYKKIDIEETCDVPQSISSILIHNSSIMPVVTVNKKLCSDFNKA